MTQYYYLAASLPALRRHERPPIDPSVFLENCARLTTPADFALIESARLGSGSSLISGNRTLDRWQAVDFGLRNELVKLRARRKSRDPSSFIREEMDDASWAAAAREIFEEESPLQAEQLVLEYQWKILDELEVGHLFDLEFLIIYHLKLQLLVRRASFDKAAGLERQQTILSGEKRND